jgi:hypothetical protein
MKVVILTEATGDNYSVEAGLADDVKHFDHHGKWSSFPSPSNNPKIPVLGPDDTVEITHIDADTLLGLFRMAGAAMPKLDYDLIEQVDLNGGSVVKDKSNHSYLFMLGVHLLARGLDFPRSEKKPQDVTQKVYEMIRTPIEKYIELGRESQEASEKAFKERLVEKKGNVGFWVVDENDAFNPSRPYDDGFDCVVVYRKHFKSISIYCAPTNDFEFGNRDVGGIEFAGHAKACGSPRGEDFALDDAKRVFEVVADEVANPHKQASILRYRGAFYVEI